MTRAVSCALPHRRRRVVVVAPRLRAGLDRGRRRRAAGRGCLGRRPRGDCFRPWPPTRSREALRAPDRWSSSTGPSRSARAASWARTSAPPSPGAAPPVYDVVAGLGGRPVTRHVAAGGARRRARRRERRSRLTFFDLDGRRRARARRGGTRLGPLAETPARRRPPSRTEEDDDHEPLKLYQSRYLRGRQPVAPDG